MISIFYCGNANVKSLIWNNWLILNDSQFQNTFFLRQDILLISDAGSDVVHSVAPAYTDFTYMAAGRERPNARYLSNEILSGPAGLPSYRNRTILFLHIGAFTLNIIIVEDNNII